jgi:drug/metabolite transporter (DMT)-like permease
LRPACETIHKLRGNALDKNTRKRRLDVTATGACLGTLLFWSMGPIFIKHLTGYIDSWTQNLLRYSVACLFWLPFLLLSIMNRRLDPRTWRRAIVPAGANITMQTLWALAFYYIGPAFMVLLTKTNILWIAGFSLICFPEERPLVRSRRFWLGLALSLAGVAGVLYFKTDTGDAKTAAGIVIALATALAWGVYTVSVRIAFRHTDSRNGFAVISLYTTLGLLAAAIAFGDVRSCMSMGVWEWWIVIVSGILCIALAHVFYYAAMRRIGATIPALVILAQPGAVLAISHAVFNESLNIWQLLFGVVLLLGAGLAIWAQQHLRPR